ncbi:MAG: hypothetical protein KatS3mg077_3361 [Candidatus Binatia bacterium]|nr:MAG: hypothetical protein KatS3mg077_3361 [Candidatus Binatia bacterium]
MFHWNKLELFLGGNNARADPRAGSSKNITS